MVQTWWILHMMEEEVELFEGRKELLYKYNTMHPIEQKIIVAQFEIKCKFLLSEFVWVTVKRKESSSYVVNSINGEHLGKVSLFHGFALSS